MSHHQITITVQVRVPQELADQAMLETGTSNLVRACEVSLTRKFQELIDAQEAEVQAAKVHQLAKAEKPAPKKSKAKSR